MESISNFGFVIASTDEELLSRKFRKPTTKSSPSTLLNVSRILVASLTPQHIIDETACDKDAAMRFAERGITSSCRRTNQKLRISFIHEFAS